MTIYNVLYFLLAAFGLGILIFIHELGHYFMARKVGMKVEAFSIGFGKAIYSWRWQGVEWKIGYLPFGGYVRIAGMEKQGKLEPHEIPDGYFGKSPLDRIKVTVMGPVVNIVFAFVLFVAIWMLGGRSKSFSEFTHYVGYVDQESELFQEGLRPGDQITAIDGKPYKGFQDLFFQAIFEDKSGTLQGNEINYADGVKTPFTFSLAPIQEGRGLGRKIPEMNMILPASYAIYESSLENNQKLLGKDSPVYESGIQPKDRIIWANGELVFSTAELQSIVNESKALLTVSRGDKVFVSPIPRILVGDLRLSPVEKADIDDWRNASGLSTKLEQTYFIPYNLTQDCVVESVLTYINQNSRENIHVPSARSSSEIALEPGDKILAVNGITISTASDMIQPLQKKQLHVIVKRGEDMTPVSWKKADEMFESSFPVDQIQSIASSIGTAKMIKSLGNLYLLAPIEPRPFAEIFENDKNFLLQIEDAKKAIAEIKDPEQKAKAQSQFEAEQKRLILGINLQNKMVIYNPSPFVLFSDVVKQTYRTLSALVTGVANPKWLSGPVGIVQVMQISWSTGAKEALYWLALISFNLGVMNLLPIPVLDGGHICFSLYEMITKKRIKPKTMERLIIPFIVILIAFAIFVTYYDIKRLFGFFS
ncbi:MAG: peptidase [Chlamydiae bacterium]|nr:peptidase [Chlamydiota bacterium]